MSRKRIAREKRERIRTLLRDTELTHEEIGAEVSVSSKTVSNYSTKYLTEEERKARKHKALSNSKSGEKHPRWKGDELDYVNDKGYRFVRAPEWWEGLRNSGEYALEHQVVYAAKKGLTCIPDGYDIHHVNGDKLDNHPLNLVMMKRWVHITLHHRLEAKEKENA